MRQSQDDQIMRALYGGYGNQHGNGLGLDHWEYARNDMNGLVNYDNLVNDIPRRFHTQTASIPNHRTGLHKVVVGHIPSGVSKWDLVDYFSQFGIVSDVRMPFGWDNQSKHRDLAIVLFSSQDCVEVSCMHSSRSAFHSRYSCAADAY